MSLREFEEEYRDRFRHGSNLEGIDADELWKGIARELPRKNSWTRRWPILLFLLLLLSILGIGFGRYSYQQQEPSQRNSNTALSKEINNVNSFADTECELIQEKTTAISPCTEPNENDKRRLKEAHQLNSKVGKLKKIAIANIENQTTEKLLTTVKQENKLKSDQGENRFLEKLEEPKPVEELQKIETIQPSLLHKVSLNPDFPASPTLANTNKNSNNPKWAFGITSGVLLWQDHFGGGENNSSYKDVLKDIHQPQGGYTIGIEVKKAINDKWSISTALRHQKAYITFAYTSTWDTTMYNDDSPTGLVDALATRRVKRQNTLQSYNIPLLIGYEYNKTQWSLGLGLGAGMNLIQTQQGHTLNKGIRITSYSDDSNDKPYSRLYWSTHLYPNISYQFNAHLRLRLQAGFAYQWHGASNLYEFQQHSMIKSFGLGIFFHP